MSNNIQRIFKPCKTRQPSIELRTDPQSYSEVDENNYETCIFLRGKRTAKIGRVCEVKPGKAGSKLPELIPVSVA